MHALYGESDGPNSPDDPALGVDHQQLFSQAQLDRAVGPAETDDHFGTALATGDYDANGDSDLTVGVPREDVAGTSGLDHGQVDVIRGKDAFGPFGFGGLDLDDAKRLQRPGTPQTGGRFGEAVR